MVREFTSGFSALGFEDDPTPGDPDRIVVAADLHGEVADSVRIALVALGSGGAVELQGQGKAMDALRKALGSLPGKLELTANSFTEAEEAFRDYAAELRECQRQLDDVMRGIGPAAVMAALPLPELSDVAASDADRIARTTAEDEILQARAQLAGGRLLALQIVRLLTVAIEVAVDRLDLAARQAIPERDFFQKVGDFFADHPIISIIIDIVIGVITIVMPVLGLALAGLSLALKTAGAVATDRFKPGTFLVDLISLVPGGNVLRGGANVVRNVDVPFTSVRPGTITDRIVDMREAVAAVPRDHAVLIGLRESGASIGLGVIEKGLNGDELDPGSIIGIGLVTGVVSGGFQFRSDRNRDRIESENLGRPQAEREQVPFDAERDLDSIREDARERIGRGVNDGTQLTIDEQTDAVAEDPVDPDGLTAEELAQEQAELDAEQARNVRDGRTDAGDVEIVPSLGERGSVDLDDVEAAAGLGAGLGAGAIVDAAVGAARGDTGRAFLDRITKRRS
ncbi:hypothetical protein [Micromonospora sp. NBC_01813]|uniref:hypothetical protein n=1 Tax=Micromonospora sp. NBC_01813 TaxID=2975988 RepID=UPI002DDA984F|nr:hypothetical protein [Micromonospora sp. NBC_01813]WSA07525.1 hypothetical protein OG958_25240 [Micromonospora sp. NBC_01813]